jgi:hypothetical protein
MLKSSLRSSLESVASNFAASVLDAIRGASLEELLDDSSGNARRGPGRPPKTSDVPTASAAPRARKSGRLARRSPEQIARALDRGVKGAPRYRSSGGCPTIRISRSSTSKVIGRSCLSG